MGATSQDYTPYVPEEPYPISPLVPLDCGDITEVNDFTTGTVESSSTIDQNSNRPVETHRYADFSQSSINIEAIEEVIYDMQQARNAGCMFGVQRRRYCDNKLAEVHHYGWVTIGGIRTSAPTAKGINARGGIPQKNTTGIFGLYYILDDSGPEIFFRSGWNPVDVSFCNGLNCSPCDSINSGCNVIFSLWSNEWNQRQILTTTDGGDVWSLYNYNENTGNESTIHCHDGVLYIGVVTDYGNVVVVPEATNPGDSPSYNRVFSTVAIAESQTTNVVKFASSGHMMYAAWENVERVGVDRSIDNGATWDTIFKVNYTQIVDIDAIGPNVAVAVFDSNNNEYGLFAVNDNGNFSSKNETLDVFPRIQVPAETIAAISLSITDFTKKDCPIIHLATKDAVLYVGYDGAWEKAYQNEYWCDVGTKINLKTSVDGYAVWFNRADLRNGKVFTIKNAGLGLDCDWIEDEFSTSVCLICNQPVVCGNENITRICEPDFIATCQCEDCINYPCESWHTTAFAVCPDDPNRAIVLAGTSCLPFGERRTSIITNCEEDPQIMSCGEGCLPPLCD